MGQFISSCCGSRQKATVKQNVDPGYDGDNDDDDDNDNGPGASPSYRYRYVRSELGEKE